MCIRDSLATEPPAPEPAAQALPIDMAPDEDADEGPASADAAPALAHPLQDLPAASPTPATTPSEAESPAAPSGSDPVLEFAPGSDADESPSPLLLQTSTQDTPREMDAGLQSAPDLDGAVPGVTLETDAPDLGDLGFVRQAERKAFWRRPLVRVLLLLATLVLLGLLGLQLAVQQRDELAARFPRLQPALEMLCERWGCTIAPRQHIASIAIASSSFTRAKGDVYQLSLTLKSSASTELATPAIELTLTDVQDQPILRRVLQPSDPVSYTHLDVYKRQCLDLRANCPTTRCRSAASPRPSATRSSSRPQAAAVAVACGWCTPRLRW